MIDPSPRRAAASTDEEQIARRRRLDCVRAGSCLLIAHREKWNAFRCGAAACYVAPDAGQAKADEVGLVELLAHALSRATRLRQDR